MLFTPPAFAVDGFERAELRSRPASASRIRTLGKAPFGLIPLFMASCADLELLVRDRRQTDLDTSRVHHLAAARRTGGRDQVERVTEGFDAAAVLHHEIESDSPDDPAFVAVELLLCHVGELVEIEGVARGRAALGNAAGQSSSSLLCEVGRRPADGDVALAGSCPPPWRRGRRLAGDVHERASSCISCKCRNARSRIDCGSRSSASRAASSHFSLHVLPWTRCTHRARAIAPCEFGLLVVHLRHPPFPLIAASSHRGERARADRRADTRRGPEN